MVTSDDAPIEARAQAPTPITGWRLLLTRARMVAALARIALRAYGDPAVALRAARGVASLAARAGPWPRHLALHRGRAFGRLFRAGFPSRAFDRLLEVELNKRAPFRAGFDLPMALLAVTRRCSLRCQHCSEWDTHGQADPLSIEALRGVAAALRARGVSHLELTGGEPLLRLDAVEAIARDVAADVDVWVLTSGAPMTARSARRLTDVNVTGVMVSLDHWDAARHDTFRGAAGTFDRALHAMTLARDAGLLVGVSVTATRETANPDDLLRVVAVAREHGATFVRVLAPRAVGRWSNADVALEAEHRAAVASLADAVDARWPGSAPIVEDLDAARRAEGCQGAGRQYLFIDAAADVHACPFCHGAAGNCLREGLDTSLARLRGRACDADAAERLVTLRRHGPRA